MTFKEVFGADGPFMRIGTEIWEIIYANILWLIFGGPFAWVAINYLPLPSGLAGFLLYWGLMILALMTSYLGQQQQQLEYHEGLHKRICDDFSHLLLHS